MHLHFTATKSTFSYFEATRAAIECHGKPGTLYSHKASVFRNDKGPETESSVTHFDWVLTTSVWSAKAQSDISHHATIADAVVFFAALPNVQTSTVARRDSHRLPMCTGLRLFEARNLTSHSA